MDQPQIPETTNTAIILQAHTVVIKWSKFKDSWHVDVIIDIDILWYNIVD